MATTRLTFPMIFGRPYSSKLGDGASTPLQLVRLHIEQKVNVNFPLLHQIAATMTFKNTHHTVLEGAFEFTLPDKATICGYGLDVNGEIVDGVVVEKQAARIIFESEVRKRIDPGFVELVTGNIFRTRVYPIEPQKTRTVRVIYQAQAAINNNGFLYQIPVQYQTDLESLDILLTCYGSATTNPSVVINPNQISNQFINDGKGKWTAEWHMTNVRPSVQTDQTISYVLPDSQKSILSAIEKDSNIGAYFALSCALPKPTEQRLFDQLDLPSRTICILWDGSLSRSNSKENRLLELNALKRIFDVWLSTVNQIELVILIFRNDMDEQILFSLRSNNWNELAKIFEDLPYDGATNFSQLASIKLTQTINYYFLFSDCISTMNHDTIQENFLSNYQAPLWIFNGNHLHEPMDLDFIRHLTEYNQYGGGYLNREKLGFNSNDLIDLIQTIPIKYIRMHSKAFLHRTYPSQSISIPLNSDRFLLVGQIQLPLPDSVHFELEFSMNHQIARLPFTLDISANESNHFGLIRRLWAQEKLNELNICKEKNKTEILAVGLEYSIVSHFTSLLVLETIQQHLQYRVCPAKSRAALYDQYQRHQTQENAKTTNNLPQLLQIWNGKCQWYDRVIPNPSRIAVPSVLPTGGISVPTTMPLFGSGTPSQGFGTSSLFGIGTSPYASPTASSFGSLNQAIPPFSQSTLLIPMFGFASQPSQQVQPFIPQQSASTSEEASSFILADANPQSSYTARISATSTLTSAYSIYLNERTAHRQSPSFYFDVASYFLAAKPFSSVIDKFNQNTEILQPADPKSTEYGLRILTNLLELELEAPQLYRTVAYKLMELKQWNFAFSLFRKIYSLRSDEPQSLRDLAVVLIELQQYDQALEYFKHILTQSWDTRWNTIQSIVLLDFNGLLQLMKTTPTNIDQRFVRHLRLDIRIVVQWDTPDTVVQLSVQEPTGQICDGYRLPETQIGGSMTHRYSQAAQPIEYLLRRAVNGEYSISVAFERNAQHTLTGATTVLVYIYKNFGSVNEEKQIKTIRLTTLYEQVHVAQIEFDNTIKHLNITCDGCLKTPIIGDRYKCIYCPDVDLCQDCQGLKHDQHDFQHPFICIRDSALYSSSIALQNRSEMIHSSTNCALCSASPIIGIRYECLICKINICEKCEFLCLHDVSHQRVKTFLPL